MQSTVRLQPSTTSTKQGRYFGTAPGCERVNADRSQYSSRLGDGAVRIRQVVETKVAEDPIKAGTAERKGLGIADLKPARETLFLRHGNHVLGKVDADDARSSTGGSLRHETRPATDVKHGLSGRDTSCLQQGINSKPGKARRMRVVRTRPFVPTLVFQ